MRVLGIDPGTIKTGYGIVDKGRGGSLIHVCNGVIKGGTGKALPLRLKNISESLNELINEYEPDCVAIETVFTAINAKSAITLGHARGVALLSAATFGAPVHEYSPKTIKLAVVGYGGATKDQVQKMVAMLLKTGTTPESDAADALAVSICHIHHNPERLAKLKQKLATT